MARIHARKKGNSGSTKPFNVEFKAQNLKKSEVEKKIVELYNKDYSKSYIGIVLRDNYGIASVKDYIGKSISDVLAQNNVEEKLPEDLKFLVKKAQLVKKHLENNKKDVHNKRSYDLIVSKIRRLSKYYKNNNKIDQKWSMEKNG